MKKTIILALFVAFAIMILTGCSTSNNVTTPQPNDTKTVEASMTEIPRHVHSFGNWEVVTSPTLKQSGVKERVCSCGEKETIEIPSKFDELSTFMTNNANDYDNGKYTVRENAKTFGKNCQLIYPGYGVDEGGWSIALTFNPSTKDTIFLVSFGFASAGYRTLAFSVQDGVVVNRYDYMYQDENFIGGYKDSISGSLYPSSLNSSTALNYTSYSAGTGKAFTYFVDGYQKDACAWAKQLVIFFNAYFESKGLSLKMSDFGFSS